MTTFECPNCGHHATEEQLDETTADCYRCDYESRWWDQDTWEYHDDALVITDTGGNTFHDGRGKDRFTVDKTICEIYECPECNFAETTDDISVDTCFLCPECSRYTPIEDWSEVDGDDEPGPVMVGVGAKPRGDVPWYEEDD